MCFFMPTLTSSLVSSHPLSQGRSASWWWTVMSRTTFPREPANSPWVILTSRPTTGWEIELVKVTENHLLSWRSCVSDAQPPWCLLLVREDEDRKALGDGHGLGELEDEESLGGLPSRSDRDEGLRGPSNHGDGTFDLGGELLRCHDLVLLLVRGWN